jgi:probable F420-dependent oxidoreductase
MAIKDKIAVGMSLPHRSLDTIDMTIVDTVAKRSEALGFSDLWVTENTLDHAFCFDPGVILAYAAAITERVRLGVAVCVLPLHHPAHVASQMASLDHVSRGRAILGIGIGREPHYAEFQIPMDKRVRRYREQIEILKALWTEPLIDFQGEIFELHGARMKLKPVQKPHLPLWFGGDHINALRRAAALGDGWIGSGGSSISGFAKCVPLLRAELQKLGRDPNAYPISKRVFIAVAERADKARAALDPWFTKVYHNPAGPDTSGIYGTPEEVREKLEALVAAGANHLLVNPVADHVEQVDALAEVVGLK